MNETYQFQVRMAWPARFEKQEDGNILVRFPDIPQALTEGANKDEALAEAGDALAEAIASIVKQGADLPLPSNGGDVMVPLDPALAIKALLYYAMGEAGLTKSALARAMDVDEKEVRRMLDPAHRGTKIARYSDALAACGFIVEVSARPLPALGVAA